MRVRLLALAMTALAFVGGRGQGGEPVSKVLAVFAAMAALVLCRGGER